MIGLVKRLWSGATDPRPWERLGGELSREVYGEAAVLEAELATARMELVGLRDSRASLRAELAAVTAERDELLAKLGDAPTQPMPRQMASVVAQLAEVEVENEKLRAEMEAVPVLPRGGSATELGRARETIGELEARVDRLTRASMARDAAVERRRRMRPIRGWSR